MLLFHAPLISTLFWPASTPLRGHLALATLSPLKTDPQILKRLGYAHEVHLGKKIRAKDFGLEFWCDQLLITLLTKFARSIVTLVGNKFSFLPITFLQYSHCTFVFILLGPFSRLFINLTVCIRALFSKPATTLDLLEQAFWTVPFFTKWVIASSFEVILARPSWHSTTGAFTSGTSNPRWFSLILLLERVRRRIWWWTFPTLIHIVAENCNCLLSHTDRWFTIANSFQDFFVHAVLFPDSWPRRSSQKFPCLFPKFLFRISCSILLFTIAFNLW